MKKIIFIITMILLPIIADAQISIGEKKTTMKKVATIAMSWYDLFEYNGKFSLSLKSSNQFDDHYWLHLGEKDEAIKSLNDLIEMCDSLEKEDVVNISNGSGKTYRVRKDGKGLSFRQIEAGMAGYATINRMYLVKTLNVIQKQ
jgi:hypothetical protein